MGSKWEGGVNSVPYRTRSPKTQLVCPMLTTESEFSRRLTHVGPRQESRRIARHPAESVARAILRMAGSRRRIVVLSLEGKLLLWLNALAPGILDRIIARFLMRR